jgi:hypothetical protein
MRKFSSWSDLLIGIVIYGGVAFILIVALTPLLLFIFQGDSDSIPGPFGNCNPELNDCQP